MMAPNIAQEARQAITLIKSFSLELDTYSPESQVLYWLNTYRAAWIRDAVIEAVYQGRYKIISVKHILAIWQRRGQPVRHFTSGFEQVIAKQLGEPVHLPANVAARPKAPKVGPMGEPEKDDFAPSPLSSSVMVSPAVKSAVFGHDHDPGLSIEAFPVESMDTLVEVYQASTPPATSLSSASRLAGSSSPSRPSATEARATERLGVSSEPIQPFRPTVRQPVYA